jgi:RibD C-terminal domain
VNLSPLTLLDIRLAAQLDGYDLSISPCLVRPVDRAGFQSMELRLKREPGNELQVHGSGELIQTLLAQHLIDELRLWIFPVLLGTRKRLFANGTVPVRLKLVETRISSTGTVLQVHQPAGHLAYGSFALEQPPEAEIDRRWKILDVSA